MKMINKKYNELTNGEKAYLKEDRAKIIACFDAIVAWDNNPLYDDSISITSRCKTDFPLTDEQLEKLSYTIPVGSSWVDVEGYIKTALKPVKQESWHDGVLEESWYEWELDYLPLKEMFELFKQHHKKTQKELFGK